VSARPTPTGRPAPGPGLVAAALLAVLILAADRAVAGRGQLLGLLVAAPLLASAYAGPGPTLLIGALALAMGAGYGEYAGVNGTRVQLVRLAAIVVAAVAAAVTGHTRERRTARIATLSRLAEVAQAAVLRPLPDRVGPVIVAARYVSADADAHIGGDLYEVLDTPYGLRAIIGDVRGKGLDAVRLASAVLGSFRHVAYERADLRNVVTDLDRAVARAVFEEDFVTALLVEIRGSQLLLLNCGHPPPLLIRQGTVRPLDPPYDAPPLGFLPTPVGRSEQLEPGDRLLLYTDGLTEARRDRAFFPLAERAAATVGRGSVGHGLQVLESALRGWVPGRLTDDIALVALDYEGSGRRSAADAPLRWALPQQPPAPPHG